MTRIELQRGRETKQVEWPRPVQVGETVRYQGAEWEVVTVYYQKERTK